MKCLVTDKTVINEDLNGKTLDMWRKITYGVVPGSSCGSLRTKVCRVEVTALRTTDYGVPRYGVFRMDYGVRSISADRGVQGSIWYGVLE